MEKSRRRGNVIKYRESLKKLFQIDKEIVTFERIGELKEKVAYYISHEDDREEITMSFYLRAQKEHTYEKRLKTLMASVKGIIKK